MRLQTLLSRPSMPILHIITDKAGNDSMTVTSTTLLIVDEVMPLDLFGLPVASGYNYALHLRLITMEK